MPTEPLAFAAITCRDCGFLLAPKQRGCPRCACNLEAEQMLGRWLRRGLILGAIVLVLLIATVLLLVRR